MLKSQDKLFDSKLQKDSHGAKLSIIIFVITVNHITIFFLLSGK